MAPTYPLNSELIEEREIRSEVRYLGAETPHFDSETSHLDNETPNLESETQHLIDKTLLFPSETSHIEELPLALREAIEKLGYRPKKEIIFSIIVELCLHKPQTKDELMAILKKGEQFIRKYLKELRNRGILDYTHPKIPNHPSQAYRVTDFGKKWWENENDDIEVKHSCKQKTNGSKQIL